LLRPQACEFLHGVDAIVHAGDIGSANVIAELQSIAPVTAIRGNIDKDAWANAFPKVEVIEVDGRYIHILHNLNDLDLDPVAAGFDVVISGHSHQPKCETIDGVLYLNPGSAGPRRFKLPIAVARLSITASGIHARIEELTV